MIILLCLFEIQYLVESINTIKSFHYHHSLFLDLVLYRPWLSFKV